MKSINDVKESLFTLKPVVITVKIDNKIMFNDIKNNNYYQLGIRSFLLTGWLTDQNGNCFWNLQNSWGTTYGKDGYLNIECDN